MFKAIRITILLLALFMVALSTYLTQARSTDWNNSLYVKIYPINGDGSAASARYIERLRPETFAPIETFMEREVERFGRPIERPVRVRLGTEIGEQPPILEARSRMDIMLWSLKMRWWAKSVTDAQDRDVPDVRIFVRYHAPSTAHLLENSVGLQKGMVGIVNARAGNSHRGESNVVIAHEFLHTLGATDKYDPADGTPIYPEGYAEPERRPRFPQQKAEIMAGRIAVSEHIAEMPKGLAQVIIAPSTAAEIRLISE